MFPYIIRLNDLSIPAYPLLYGLGITVAGIILLILGSHRGYSIRKLGNLLLVLAVAIVVGGRVFFVFQYHSDFSGKWLQALDLANGGQVFYGGLCLAIPALIFYCRVFHLPVRDILDLVTITAPLGLAIGRLGCFCKGCCYGKVSDLPWAVKFPKHVDITGQVVGSPVFVHQIKEKLISHLSSQSLPVHPTQVYSALASFCIFLFMLWLWKKEYVKGNLIFVYLFIYALFRFNIEFIRNNEIFFAGLTIAQVISAAIILPYCFLYFRRYVLKRGDLNP